MNTKKRDVGASFKNCSRWFMMRLSVGLLFQVIARWIACALRCNLTIWCSISMKRWHNVRLHSQSVDSRKRQSCDITWLVRAFTNLTNLSLSLLHLGLGLRPSGQSMGLYVVHACITRVMSVRFQYVRPWANYFIILASSTDRDTNGGPVGRNWLPQWFQTLNLSFTFSQQTTIRK